MNERELGLRIARCAEIGLIDSGQKSNCSQVVAWQDKALTNAGRSADQLADARHLPEPWAGSLSTAPIMFLSSNPSFDPDERYPDRTWPETDVEAFLTTRFVNRGERSFGAIDGPAEADQDRTILHSDNGAVVLSRRVRTWNDLRARAAAILGTSIVDTLASRDYVMTEIVHCKSQKEVGVAAALPTCVDRWFMEVLALSPARLVVVSGKPAGIATKMAVARVSATGLPSKWGAWNGTPSGAGRWPSSNAELRAWVASGMWSLSDQESHTAEVGLDVKGEPRRYTFVWLPHPVRSVPQRLTDPELISPGLLERWRFAALGGARD